MKAAEMKAAEMKAAQMKTAKPKVYKVLNKGGKTPLKRDGTRINITIEYEK